MKGTNGSWAFGGLLLLVALSAGNCARNAAGLGIFDESVDIGETAHAGTARFDRESERYFVSGSGANIWGERDSFHFLWRRIGGDLTLTADVEFPDPGGDPHRKAGWMVRESLEPDAPYADAVVHGDGLVSLQYRKETGGPTEEIQAFQKAPATLRLERTGALFSLSVSSNGGPFQPVGSILVDVGERPYVGLAVCSHQQEQLVEAVFSSVSVESRTLPDGVERVVESTLEVVDVETGERTIRRREKNHFEAPNWSRDGRYFVINSHGLLYRIGVDGGEPVQINTGSLNRNNNDHGFSPDGNWLAISDHTEQGASLIYVIPADGGEPRLVTSLGPSYWHGWSPDGKTLAYCAERNGQYDVYTIPAEGGIERQLTNTAGLDDGPDYSPDGDIFFNSERTGLMKIWRVSADGGNPTQMTFDQEFADWFPHPSPDGRQVLFLSYDRSVEGHPPNQEVALRIMPLEGGPPRVLARFYGGQGTINVPSWSPDSQHAAFVSYRLVIP